ncbi:MAG: cupin domain-containing protein [Burkholderiales bacterium]
MKKPTRESRQSSRRAGPDTDGGTNPTTFAPDDRPLDDTTIAALIASMKPIALPREREAALRMLVLSRAQEADRDRRENQFVTVQGTQGTWEPIFPGVEMKLLHDHGEAQSFLVRLAPGARIPLHSHASDELCVVLEGTVQLNNQVGVAGTFHLAQAGSRHDVVSSATGCVLFLRADLRNGMRF